jgi:hypothetical protein
MGCELRYHGHGRSIALSEIDAPVVLYLLKGEKDWGDVEMKQGLLTNT